MTKSQIAALRKKIKAHQLVIAKEFDALQELLTEAAALSAAYTKAVTALGEAADALREAA